MTEFRPEQPEDLAVIRELVSLAFADEPHSNGTEPLIIDALREDGALDLSLVAEVQGAVVGHIAFSAASVGESSSGWFLVGPVAVLPDYQRRGIGSDLIEASLDILRSRGAVGCVLVGAPDFYHRFGFTSFAGVTWPGVPEEYVLCLPFGERKPEGEIGFHPAFLIEA